MAERIRREEKRVRPLLCTRQEAMVMLACSTDSLEKLEAKGKLKPIRFDEGKVRYNIAAVEALARGE